MALIRNYREIFKSKFSIRYQFDMFHGNGNLDKAIALLQIKIKQILTLCRNNYSFNQGNMFISKSSKIIDRYFLKYLIGLKNVKVYLGSI